MTTDHQAHLRGIILQGQPDKTTYTTPSGSPVSAAFDHAYQTGAEVDGYQVTGCHFSGKSTVWHLERRVPRSIGTVTGVHVRGVAAVAEAEADDDDPDPEIMVRQELGEE